MRSSNWNYYQMHVQPAAHLKYCLESALSEKPPSPTLSREDDAAIGGHSGIEVRRSFSSQHRPSHHPERNEIVRNAYWEIAKHSAVYGVGQILGRVALLLLLPLYTSYLRPADYGCVAILDLTSAVLAILLGGGIASAVVC